MLKLIVLLAICYCASAERLEPIADRLCTNLHYYLEMKLLVEYFQDTFFITLVDIDTHHEHRVNALKCMKMSRHARPFIIYDSLESIKFKPHKTNSISTFSKNRGYYIKCSQYEAIKFFQRMSKHNPIVKVMVQLTDDSNETSNEILRTAYEKYKMLNVATLHRQARYAALKFYNPFKNSGEYHVINVTRQSVLSEIKSYQRDRIWNLHKFPIRIYIFESPISVKLITHTDASKIGFSYADGELANMLAKKMNFTKVYVRSQNEPSHYGFQLKNGSFSGGIGAIENDRADLLVNHRLISELNTTRAIFLQPISSASYKFVIRRFKRRRVLPLSIFGLYDVPSKIIACSLLISFPIIYMVINNLERRLLAEYKGERVTTRRSLLNYSTYIFALNNNVSMRQTHIAPLSSRIIIFVVIFYALIASSIFQGNIVRCLNVQTSTGSINSIEDLFNHNYKFTLNNVLSSVLMQQTGNDLSRNLRKIAASATTVSKEQGINMTLHEENYACLLDTLYISTNYLDRFYDNKTGEPLLEAVPEKAFEFYDSIMTARDFPLTSPLNQHILKWIEGGFDTYHMNRAADDNRIKIVYEKHKNGLTNHSKFKSLAIEDLISVFILYGIMITICIIAFLLEVVYFYITPTTE